MNPASRAYAGCNQEHPPSKDPPVISTAGGSFCASTRQVVVSRGEADDKSFRSGGSEPSSPVWKNHVQLTSYHSFINLLTTSA